MARIVMKFGGTSVGDMDRIRNVARRVKAHWDKGDEVAVIVSAMAGVTNQLVDYCQQASSLFDKSEYDSVVATGEQVTSGLLAIILQEMGVSARSWLGWQLPLTTDDSHGSALISSIGTEGITQGFADRQVAILAGFQGVSEEGRITTLGRGGSDTSAVALAAALEADRCDIYTDVDGVYTTDPRICPKARKIDKITFEEMLEMASLGAKVLQTRSVSMGMRHKTKIQVLSSFEDKPGTLVCDEDETMEKNIVTGVAFTKDEAKITLVGVPDKPGVAANVFSTVGSANVNVDMIVQARSDERDETNMTFTVGRVDLERTLDVLNKNQDKIKFRELITNASVAKVSVIGVGMRSHSGVAQTMFTTLSEKNINIQVISTSEIKISVLISDDYLELAVRALHTAFGLDAE